MFDLFKPSPFIHTTVPRQLGEIILEDLAEHLLCPKIHAPAGSVVYCRLACQVEHSGLALGDGTFVHLDGAGIIERVGPRDFVRRLSGLNPAFTIYVGCDFSGDPIACRAAARRAKKLVGQTAPYNLITANCHRFVASLVTDDPPEAMLSIKEFEILSIAGQQIDQWRPCQ